MIPNPPQTKYDLGLVAQVIAAGCGPLSLVNFSAVFKVLPLTRIDGVFYSAHPNLLIPGDQVHRHPTAYRGQARWSQPTTHLKEM